jgi:ribosomal protein S18 acetylase RimI-like enzyme
MMASSAGWSIRDGRTEDAGAILDLWLRADATPSVTDTAEAVRRAIAHPAAWVLLAEADGQVVGSIIGAFDGWRGNIYRLAVDPAYRRRGVARALVAAVEQRLRETGGQRITALVEHDHAAPVAFWPAAGYERDRRIVRYVRSLRDKETE